MLVTNCRIVFAKDTETETSSGPSNAYGEGGTLEEVFEKDPQHPGQHLPDYFIKYVYRDKCGRIRQVSLAREHTTHYFNPEGDGELTKHDNGTYSYNTVPPKGKDEGFPKKLEPKNAQGVIDNWQRAKIPPCDKVDVVRAPPEKPKDHPNPLGKLLQNVNIGIGVSGGHTVGHDDHKGDHRVSDHKRTSSTTSSKKTVTSMCVCHPCTCSPCRCH